MEDQIMQPSYNTLVFHQQIYHLEKVWKKYFIGLYADI